MLERLGELSVVEKEISQLEASIEKELEQRRAVVSGAKKSKKRRSESTVGSTDSYSFTSSSESDVEDELSKEVDEIQKFIEADTLGLFEDKLNR